jgi:hypothetical protein
MRANKIFILVFFFGVVFSADAGFCQNRQNVPISHIDYDEKTILPLTEIPLSPIGIDKNSHITHKVDELIGLLEAHKRAYDQGVDIENIQKKINEITEIIDDQNAGPTKISAADFHDSLCFKCHHSDDVSPADKTLQQWQRLIGEDGHSIFAEIPWTSPFEKNLILQFLMENAGNYRSQGIGLWD